MQELIGLYTLLCTNIDSVCLASEPSVQVTSRMPGKHCLVTDSLQDLGYSCCSHAVVILSCCSQDVMVML